MTDNRSPEEIEREIERERAGLSSTLEDLQDRFSIDGVVRQISDQFREHGGDIGASVSRSVRENPMALALTGVGLAWMIFGNRPSDKRVHDRGYVANRRVSSNAGYRDYDYRPYGSYGDTSYDDTETDPRQYDSRPGRARGIAGPGVTPAWARDHDDTHDRHDHRTFGDKARATGDTAGNRVSSVAGSVSDTASGVANTVSDKASGAVHAVSDAAARAKDGVHHAGDAVASGVRGARDRVAEATEHAADRAAALRARLSEGTEALSEEARERVIAARHRAMEARDAAARYTRQGRERAVDLFEEQPLIAGALAIAVGAAIGAALPRTRTEDRYFGEQSDELIEEAERIFAEERAKVTEVAHAAMDEAKQVMSEARDEVKDKAAKAKADADRDAPADTAAEAVAERAKQAGQRIADAAKTEAEKQDLGKPNA
ncbi:DUF3618 domain-containing protein [Oceaniovalibus sp. ACAM 378]|uniref:DUF3618 domain-containing protein n=1 Tax=Oceaniovalibus sp. ACAM 378 TaxID=2599923 RepID=UPI0011D41810|nr:DUF3618 domain-containing protein [Oceaniovalibus sp. ACAM 378]TYB87010.1 DUF3618 domain-containing protein [Oceaniovalibus sp. ACAM 378]